MMKTLKKNGFSLLELMIAIAIMAIISAIAIPQMANYLAERRLNGAARMVMSDLMMARQRAVSQNNRSKLFLPAITGTLFWTMTTTTGPIDHRRGGRGEGYPDGLL